MHAASAEACAFFSSVADVTWENPSAIVAMMSRTCAKCAAIQWSVTFTSRQQARNAGASAGVRTMGCASRAIVNASPNPA